MGALFKRNSIDIPTMRTTSVPLFSYRSWRGTGYVYTLFKWPFETTRFSQEYKAWGGILESATPGSHKLTLIATDFGENTVTAEGPVIIGPPPAAKNTLNADLELDRLEYGRFNIVLCRQRRRATDSVVVQRQGRGEGSSAFSSPQGLQVAFPMSEMGRGRKSKILPRPSG
jgi:hypothetical protein